jgi:hypothetical protein
MLRYEIDGKVIHLIHPDYCAGCCRKPENCPGSVTLRERTKDTDPPHGAFLADWKRGEACPLVIK